MESKGKTELRRLFRQAGDAGYKMMAFANQLQAVKLVVSILVVSE